MHNICKNILFIAFGLFLAVTPVSSKAADTLSEAKVVKQTLFLPVYSQIPALSGMNFQLSATISVRNTDPKKPIRLTHAKYFDHDGNLIRDEFTEPLAISAMGSTYFLVKVNDKAGGVGANYIITWESDTPVTAPVVESVMVGTLGTAGISFTSRAVVVDEKQNKKQAD